MVHLWGMIEGIPADSLAVPVQLPGASCFQNVVHPIPIVVSGPVMAQSSLCFSHNLEKKILNFVKILICYLFENKRKPNDRVGPVVPKIYEKSVKAARRPYFISFLNSRTCHPLVSKRVRRHRAVLPSFARRSLGQDVPRPG